MCHFFYSNILSLEKKVLSLHSKTIHTKVDGRYNKISS